MIRKRNLPVYLLILLLAILFLFLYNKIKIVTIPIELYSNSIVVPTTINGITYNFLLDTGAPTSISDDIFKNLKSEVKDSVEGVDFYGNKKWVKRTIIPRLKLGSFDVNNITVGVVRPMQNFKDSNLFIDGYLGSDAFNNLIITIDTKNKQFSLSKSIFNIKHRKTKCLKFETFELQKTPLFLISFSDGSCLDTALFDTGCNDFVYKIKMDSYNKLISNNIIKIENIIDTLTTKDNNSGLFGKQNDTINYVARIDSVSIGKLKMFGFPVTTFSSDLHSVIGAPFLNYGIGTFDFKKKVFYYELYE